MKRLIIACFCGVTLSACGAPSEAEIQAQVATAMSATQRALPTLAPTLVPTVAPTAVPEMTPAAYKLATQQEAKTITDALSAFTDLIKQPNLTDSGWRAQLNTQLAAIHTAHKNIADIKPPTVMAAIHKAVLDATGDCDAAATDIPAGIDGDQAAMTRAITLLGTCGEKMTTATIKLQAFDISQ